MITQLSKKAVDYPTIKPNVSHGLRPIACRRRIPEVEQQTTRTLFEYPPRKSDQESSRSLIIFTQHDYKQLQSPKFLNDTIVTFFMQYHLDLRVDPAVTARVHIFNSFFFTKIKSLGRKKNGKSIAYDCVSRWYKGIKIFSKDFLVMPVYDDGHWLLIIICYPANLPRRDGHKIPDEELFEPSILVLNSCAGLAPTMKRALGQFLKWQWRQEHGTPRNFTINQTKNNGIRLVFADVPQQRDNYNCGVYLLGNFYSFIKNPRQAYIYMFRNRNLKDWFLENDIDISRERTRMVNIARHQSLSWTKSAQAVCKKEAANE